MIRYSILPVKPNAHLFQIEIEIEEPCPKGQVVTLAAWIPGSYLIRDFARHITEISAYSKDNQVRLVQQDKQTWRADPVSGTLRLLYQVYAWDLSVRGAHLDQTHGYFNGASVFFRVVGQEDHSCELMIYPPDQSSSWRVATTLLSVEVDAFGFGRFSAENYETLIDHPVEMGVFDLVQFQVDAIKHQMAISGKALYDSGRLAQDLSNICRQHTKLFQDLPIDRYLFLTRITADGYGGLEHRDCSSLICKRDDLPKLDMQEVTDGYRQFLGLCSHEYFHLWNVKRIRPKILQQADLSQEVYTELLWAFEGITSYYDDLALCRAGCIDSKSYLELLARTITRVMRGSGRTRQSVAESSFNAWTKFYKQDENAPNAIVSYYTKGSLVALGLDVSLRTITGDTCSLDDLMRLLWSRYGKQDLGVPEDGVLSLVNELVSHASATFDEFFESYIHGTVELPLSDWFDEIGIGFRLRPAINAEDKGGCLDDTSAESEPKVRLVLGAHFKQAGDFVEITQVAEHGAAQLAGLSAGDRLIAIDGLQVSVKDIEQRVAACPTGGSQELVAFRQDELLHLSLKPLPAPADTCDLWLNPGSLLTDKQLRRRQQWLGENNRLPG